ncbi:MAG: VPLPA-CTERM sorting domain-containing protein [Rhodobacteraceae bacterium]|nr:VPLPA-CTERM sorting domain-containing protein [Paracoccaceae bacterium]
MLRVMGLSALVAAAAAPSGAATVTYTTLATYTAALGYTPSVGETFNGGTLDGTLLSSLGGVFKLTNNKVTQVGGTAKNGQTTTLNFSEAVTSFAVDIGSLLSGEVANVYLDGVLSATLSGSTKFFAVISPTAFTTVTFADATNPTINTQFNIDNLRAVPAPVPLPAGLPLLVAGLGAVGLMGRKRRPARA